MASVCISLVTDAGIHFWLFGAQVTSETFFKFDFKMFLLKNVFVISP